MRRLLRQLRNRKRRGLATGAASGASLRMGLALLLATTVAPAPAAADSLVVDPQVNTERSYIPFEELSYEVIVDGMVGFRADVRLRTALHNNSSREQDMVLSLALPRGAEIHGLRVARGGEWRDGAGTQLAADAGRSDPGTVFVRGLAPDERGDLPGAELIAFSLAPGSTTQIELQLLVPPRMRGDRWELTLPERGNSPLGLSRDRRVIVRNAAEFWVDGRHNQSKPALSSSANDRVILAWPASLPRRRAQAPTLTSRYEVTPAADRSGGDFRLYLRLGATSALRPDHVIVVVDRSKSTSPSMHRAAFTMISALFDALPAKTTFDAVSFARAPTPLLDPGERPTVDDPSARSKLASALDAGARQQGTDLASAFRMVGQRLAATTGNTDESKSKNKNKNRNKNKNKNSKNNRNKRPQRPLIIVVTDGMLPLSVTPEAVDAALAEGLEIGAHSRGWPEILFAVDEPMVAQRGLDPEHPVSLMAAGLGSRISLETLEQKTGSVTDLLEAPQVLRDLKLTLPKNAVLDRAAPAGLVAGNFVVLTGTYEGRRPPQPRIRGEIGRRTVRVSPKTIRADPPPTALVASVGVTALASAVAEGLPTPPWLTRKHQRDAQLGITSAGRGGYTAKGFLDWRIFKNYLGTRVFPRARACYNRALTRDQTLGGRVVFSFEVGKGEVMFAEISQLELDHPDEELRQCLLEAAWSLTIPAGQLDDQLYRLSYPLVLNPPEGGTSRMSEDPLGEGTVELLLRSGP